MNMFGVPKYTVNNVVAGVVWPCEIPPGWELEWVEEDE
jgi:hypothetical protein